MRWPRKQLGLVAIVVLLAAAGGVPAAEAHQDAILIYSSGLDGILVLLESQRRSFNTASQRLTAEFQRKIARVSLVLSLGGPWGMPEHPDPILFSGTNEGVQQ